MQQPKTSKSKYSDGTVQFTPLNNSQKLHWTYMQDKDYPVVIATGPAGVGKAQPLYSSILTPSGWTAMGNIKVGDKVLTPCGNESTVVGVYPQGSKPVYEVTFSDGRKVRYG